MDNRAVSDVVGVILMIAIIIAITSVVYVYVYDLPVASVDGFDVPLSGNITDLYRVVNLSSGERSWFIEIDNTYNVEVSYHQWIYLDVGDRVEG